MGDADRNATRQLAGELRRDEGEHDERPARGDHGAGATGDDGGLGNPSNPRLEGRGPGVRAEPGDAGARDGEGAARGASTLRNPWSNPDWIPCRVPGSDEIIWRPVEPGTFPLASRVPGRVGMLRGYGNSIVPQVAAAFLEAVMAELGIAPVASTPEP